MTAETTSSVMNNVKVGESSRKSKFLALVHVFIYMVENFSFLLNMLLNLLYMDRACFPQHKALRDMLNGLLH